LGEKEDEMGLKWNPFFIPIAWFAVALVAMIGYGCAQDSEASRVNEALKNAGERLGIVIPIPHYLPDGYRIVNVMTSDNSSATLLISNNEKQLIELEVMWRPTGLVPYRIDLDSPTVKFDGTTGQLIESGETKIVVVWNWYPERYKPGLLVITLTAPKGLPVPELASIAASVGY
jgi:hypothetical protein